MLLDIEVVLELIRSRPKIRTVEIADIVDCDPELIEPALAGHIERGDIVVTPVTAPNGRSANGFEFASSIAILTAKAVHAEVAVAELPPRESKVDAAVRYVKANGSASSTELRRVMELTGQQSPLSYLGAALKDGRLRKHGVNYYPGNRAEDAASPPATAKVDVAAPPRKRYARRGQIPGNKSTTSEAFRCAIWSDGVMELRRDGATFATLTPAELAVVVKEAAARCA